MAEGAYSYVVAHTRSNYGSTYFVTNGRDQESTTKASADEGHSVWGRHFSPGIREICGAEDAQKIQSQAFYGSEKIRTRTCDDHAMIF